MPLSRRFAQQLIQAVNVARVQANARLVEDIEHVYKAAAEMLDHLDALRLAAGERIGFAIEAEVFQADIDHVLQPLGRALPR